jgi:uncharacterized protein YraI
MNPHRATRKFRTMAQRISVGTLLLATAGAGALVAASPARAAQRYAVTANGVALRSGPGTGYAIIQRVNTGTPVDVECQAQNGTNVGGNRTWDRLTGGQWIADYFLNTPSFNSYAPGLRDCNGPVVTPPQPGVTPNMRTAANWAVAELHSPDPTWSDHFRHPWSGWCEQFVENANGFRFRFPSAIAHYQQQRAQGRIHTDANPPAGAVVFYGGGNGFGHVGVALGNGQVISTQGFFGQRLPVKQHPVVGYLSNPYLGWAIPYGA